MTEPLYLQDSYLREFDALVTEVRDEGVCLDRSAFYPGGGGQPADHGWLESEDGVRYPVAAIRRVEGIAVHCLDGLERPRPGASLRGTIDWDRRYLLMRTHTAMHMLSGVIFKEYGAQVTGGNMEPAKGRLDFEFENLTREMVGEVEQKLRAEVEAGRDTHVSVLPREQAFAIPDLVRTKINLLPAGIQQVRIVDIEGLDLQADGGTHVANTREVGAVSITGYKSKGRINKRLTIELDQGGGARPRRRD